MMMLLSLFGIIFMFILVMTIDVHHEGEKESRRSRMTMLSQILFIMQVNGHY